MPTDILTDQQGAERMQSFATRDTESRHCDADALLCQLLTQLGYPETIKVFKSLKKWYA